MFDIPETWWEPRRVGVIEKALHDDEEWGAEFSADKLHRYRLWRDWDRDRPLLTTIMLNPSTADALKNDPTVERCCRYAKRWGMGGLVVTNLFALRSTDPRALKGAPDPVGARNDMAIVDAATNPRCGMVLCAWGNHGTYMGRADAVKKLLAPRLAQLYCLGQTKTSQPRHPLYLRSDAQPVRFE